MSSPDTQLTPEERKLIRTQNTDYHNETVKDPLSQKLLLCLLESVQDLTEEVKTLRKQNETMKNILESIVVQHGALPHVQVRKV